MSILNFHSISHLLPRINVLFAKTQNGSADGKRSVSSPMFIYKVILGPKSVHVYFKIALYKEGREVTGEH